MQMEHFDNLSQRLHIAATVSWHHKGAIQFYNDENNNLLRPRKPRKSRYQSAAVYQQRIIDWEASLPPPPRGNAMTQVYYTARLLPVYAHEIHQHRIQYGYDCIFQQDNDPSHGTSVTKQGKTQSDGWTRGVYGRVRWLAYEDMES